MKATREEAAQAIQAYTKQEIEAQVNVSFPVFIVEHLGPIPMPDGSRPRGVEVGRATVRPVARTVFHDGREIPESMLINIVAPPYMRGPFMTFGSYDYGQRVKATVSTRALDYLIDGRPGAPDFIITGEDFDVESIHPIIPRFLNVKDAWIDTDAAHLNLDPKYPKEYLNDYGIMLLEKADGEEYYKPMSKFIMRRNKDIIFECRNFYVRASENIWWNEIGGYNVVHLEPGHPPVTNMFATNVSSFEPGQITGPEETDPNSGVDG